MKRNYKKTLKKFICVFSVVMMIVAFSSCGSNNDTEKDTESNKGTLKIVTTIFPIYDWTKNILGDGSDVEVSWLLDSGVDLHSFQPTSEDMMEISDCDVFVYVGGESDEWVEEALKQVSSDDMITVNLMEAMGDQLAEEEVKEGMEAEEEHGEGEKHGAEEEHEDGPEYDEHVWLSAKNAQTLCRVIEEAIAEKDPENAETYKANLDDYLEQIKRIDDEYTRVTGDAKVKTLLFGDRFPFRYMTDEYGLDYYAAFVGCSAETEASFKTISFLAEKMDELGLSRVCTIDGSDKKIAETIIENTESKDQKIVTLDSMQSVTPEDAEGGVSWISIMESNLEVLKDALQ